MPIAIYWKNGERREQHCADDAAKSCLERSYPAPFEESTAPEETPASKRIVRKK
jgi:hypothetical protein